MFMKNSLRGFTLIELLVALLILTTIGSLVLSVFIVSLRSSTKVQNLQLIRQNGNFTLIQMTKSIRFAAQFDGVSTDGTNFITSCELPTTNINSLTSYKYIRFTAYDGGVTTYACAGTPQTIASNSATMVNTDLFTVSSCSFYCTQANVTSSQSIGIRFTLSKNNPLLLVEDPSPVQFQTSVTIRNAQ
jgi:prepilin-type N-terminal cleavage/methylation domain-containing protein